MSGTLAQRRRRRPQGQDPGRRPGAGRQAALRGGAHRRVRRLAHRGARGGDAAAGRGAGRDLPGPRVVRARGARAVVVHRRVVGDPHPRRRAGDARLPHRRRERGGRAGRRCTTPATEPRRSRSRWQGSPEPGTRARSRPTSPSTSRSPRASGNRFYVDLLGSLGPMMIMLPRTRLGEEYSMTDATPRRAGPARARQRRRRRPCRRRRHRAGRDAGPPGQHPPPRQLTHLRGVRTSSRQGSARKSRSVGSGRAVSGGPSCRGRPRCRARRGFWSQKRPELLDPGVDLLQPARVDGVEPPGALGAHGREAVVAQHLEVLATPPAG